MFKIIQFVANNLIFGVHNEFYQNLYETIYTKLNVFLKRINETLSFISLSILYYRVSLHDLSEN